MIYVNHFSLLNALGNDPTTVLAHWEANEAPGMQPLAAEMLLSNEKKAQPPVYGHVVADLPEIPAALCPTHRSRNNQLLLAALNSGRETWDALLAQYPKDRVGVVLGTSTSGSEEAATFVGSEGKTPADFSSWSQEMGDPARFLATFLGLHGPAYTICTACTSSARAIMSGARLIEMGVVDAVIVGGADTFARMPLNGFDALGVLSPTLSAPLTQDRQGITIGEAVGLLWLSKSPMAPTAAMQNAPVIALLGAGESSDAYHMSSPEPNGTGAEAAMRHALAAAKLTPEAVDYINLHGTGTQQNDAAECAAVSRVFGEKPVVSSTKSLTGHTLGAAGITDAILAILTLCRPVTLPSQCRDGQVIDPALAPVHWVQAPTRLAPKTVMSNNFAFGGNNTALIFGLVATESTTARE